MYAIKLIDKSYLSYPQRVDRYGNMKQDRHRPQLTNRLSLAERYDCIADAERDAKRFLQFVESIVKIGE